MRKDDLQKQCTDKLIPIVDETTKKPFTIEKLKLLIKEHDAVNAQNISVNPKPKLELDNGIKFIDLFCGVGGFHQAMKRMGGTCVFASDIDKNCQQVYKSNYGIDVHGDVATADTESMQDFDVLCAGFPCQSFSNAGKKKGQNDKRGNLFEHILTIASVKHPRFMFLENVKHIRKIDKGQTFTHIVQRITETGYVVQDFNVSPTIWVFHKKGSGFCLFALEKTFTTNFCR